VQRNRLAKQMDPFFVPLGPIQWCRLSLVKNHLMLFNPFKFNSLLNLGIVMSTLSKYFCGHCLHFSFKHTNNEYILSQEYVHNSIAMSYLKILHPGGTKTRVFCSWGGCVVHCATQPGPCDGQLPTYYLLR
jgi:hypothetical protein